MRFILTLSVLIPALIAVSQEPSGKSSSQVSDSPDSSDFSDSSNPSVSTSFEWRHQAWDHDLKVYKDTFTIDHFSTISARLITNSWKLKQIERFYTAHQFDVEKRWEMFEKQDDLIKVSERYKEDRSTLYALSTKQHKDLEIFNMMDEGSMTLRTRYAKFRCECEVKQREKDMRRLKDIKHRLVEIHLNMNEWLQAIHDENLRKEQELQRLRLCEEKGSSYFYESENCSEESSGHDDDIPSTGYFSNRDSLEVGTS